MRNRQPVERGKISLVAKEQDCPRDQYILPCLEQEDGNQKRKGTKFFLTTEAKTDTCAETKIYSVKENI